MTRQREQRGRRGTGTPLLFIASVGFSLLCVVVFLGCAGRQLADLGPGIETRGHYIAHVPFTRQSQDKCGPAALANVFAFWGRNIDLDRIISGVYLPRLRGSLPMDMEKFARENGFRTVAYYGSLADLKAQIKNNTPVICLLDLGIGLYRRPHYVTVTGFDDVNSAIIEHDGVQPDSVMQYETFDKKWNRAGRWMLVITPETAGDKS